MAATLLHQNMKQKKILKPSDANSRLHGTPPVSARTYFFGSGHSLLTLTPRASRGRHGHQLKFFSADVFFFQIIAHSNLFMINNKQFIGTVLQIQQPIHNNSLKITHSQELTYSNLPTTTRPDRLTQSQPTKLQEPTNPQRPTYNN